MNRHYRVSSHIRECFVRYAVMAGLLILGISGGLWFYSSSGNNIIAESTVLMLISGCSEFWPCMAGIAFAWLLFCGALFVCGLSVWLMPACYLLVLWNGIVIGGSLEAAFGCGFAEGIFFIAAAGAITVIRCYLVAVNSCTLRNIAPLRRARPGGAGAMRIRIYISCALLSVLLSAVSTICILLLNNAL